MNLKKASRRKKWLYIKHLILFPGIVIHELNHYLCAKVLGVEITDIKLCSFSDFFKTGTLGYVGIYIDSSGKIMLKSGILVSTAPQWAGIIEVMILAVPLIFRIKKYILVLLYNNFNIHFFWVDCLSIRENRVQKIN